MGRGVGRALAEDACATVGSGGCLDGRQTKMLENNPMHSSDVIDWMSFSESICRA
jgi:hypothetical protein